MQPLYTRRLLVTSAVYLLESSAAKTVEMNVLFGNEAGTGLLCSRKVTLHPVNQHHSSYTDPSRFSVEADCI